MEPLPFDQEIESLHEPPSERPRRSGQRRIKVFAVLPTLLTLGNAACGFGAITFAAKVGPESMSVNPVVIAAVLVFLGMIFDVLDGHAARWANQTSEFGAQLDSLCDVITFGVAPAFIMLKATQDAYPPRVLWVIAVLYVICAVLRLARFNVETDEEDTHESFSGLPSPAAGATVASFVIAAPGLRELADTEMSPNLHILADWLMAANRICLPIITLGLAFLMVSWIRYPHVFTQLFHGKRNFRHLMALVFAGVAIFTVRELAVPLVLSGFVLGSPIRAFWTKVVMSHRRTE